jgi:competence protein ComEC
VLFDAGPAWSNGNDAGASVVVPMLRRQGLAQLERVLISHHHQDHAGGLTGVLRTMPGTRLMGDHGYRSIAGEPCRAGQRWRWDEYEFHILHPRNSTNDSQRGKNRRANARMGNDDSCVMRVSGPGGSVLLPADIEAPAEATVLRAARGALRSNILLVPHHGSRTSSTLSFLRAVRPKLAINSSGHRNRFSLPADDVIDRYRALDIQVIDTACVGAIEVRLRAGQEPRVTHWRQSQLRFWHTRDSASHCRDPSK